MKKTLLLTLIIPVSLSLNAQKTEVMYLSGTDKDHTLQWDFFCTSGRNSGKWSKIDVPSNWELQGFGTYHYGRTDMAANEKGMYKYKFAVPEKWKKKRVFIVFEASMTDTEVKVNGQSAGPVHQGGFYRFKYDITGLLSYGAENLLEVTVSKESSDASINNAERTSDYWVFGGIFRPVYLEAVPDVFIDRVAIDARADGSFSMDVFTEGTGKGLTLNTELQTSDGMPAGEAMTAKVAEGQNKTLIRGQIINPLLWNPESPNRYHAIVTLYDGKKIVHQINQKFGFRTVEVRAGDGIYVNNQKIIFKGVCRHTFWPSSGRTSSKKLAIEDVNLMKDMNMNAVRMSHYPPDQFFLDVCDSLGLFVLDELAGWQKFYDTPVAKRLVKEMVIRDVNHPSVVLWDNGNEGGFNKDAREDYAMWDPQKRTVIEPWSVLNGTDTKHYPGYDYVVNALNKGKEIYFPTEFLHGLFDGGAGAGLDDYWNLMISKPLSAGGFIWVFADEGVERKDLNDSIDTSGNLAPDGILGPYHQKEGSFYTIKEIWSPVFFKDYKIDKNFNKKLQVENRYICTNLNQCSFSFELVKFRKIFPGFETIRQPGKITSPDIPAGGKGSLTVNVPPDWGTYDVLYITATDHYGRNINTWSWNITKPEDYTPREVVTNTDKVTASENDSLLTISSGKTEISFSKKTGLIASVKSNNSIISFANGPRFAGVNRKFKGLKHYASGKNHMIDITYDSLCTARWTMLQGGWLKLDYEYYPHGRLDFAGITFSYPENLVTGAVLLANGPYHVWKNRLKGNQFGLFNKEYNNTSTGESWIYPEFKGYYNNFYAVQVKTKELPFTIVSATDNLYLHLFTPAKAKYSETKGVSGSVNPPFPDGDISILHNISPIGTKFSEPESEGPQGQKNIFRSGESLTGTLYFRFGY